MWALDIKYIVTVRSKKKKQVKYLIRPTSLSNTALVFAQDNSEQHKHLIIVKQKVSIIYWIGIEDTMFAKEIANSFVLVIFSLYM